MSEEKTNLQYDEDLVLAASAARTASFTGTGIAVGPTGLVFAVIIVSVLTSGASLVPAIQQSSDDAVADAYAAVPVGGGLAAAITATGVYVIPFNASEEYVRLVVTPADSKSVTYRSFITSKWE